MHSLRRNIKKWLRRMATALQRLCRRIAQNIRKTKVALKRLPPKKRLLVLGGGLGGLAVLITGIVLVCTLGGKERARPVQTALDSQGMLLAGAEPGSDLMDVTPPPSPSPTPTPVPTPTPTPDPTLKRGMEREDVRPLQERLIALGYLELDETTIKYGPATEDAVKRFQRQVNFTEELGIELVEDGIAGLKTQELLFGDSAPKYVVKFGMTGDDITDMQEQLKDLGYMSAITGYYGDKTVTALKEFQDRNGLSPDGLCGEKTFSLLYSDDARESASKSKEARTKANIDKMIATAKAQLGDRYVLGNKGPNSFDCSGLVYYCLKEAGSNRRRLNAAGYSNVSDWEKITKISNVKRGDLIFFYDNNFTKVGHVGIAVSSSEMVDASSSNGKVVRRSFRTSYWEKHFVCARRPW